MHSVGILERDFLGKRIFFFEFSVRQFPIGITFHRDENIGRVFLNQLVEFLKIFIELINVYRNDFHCSGSRRYLFYGFLFVKFGVAD